MRVTETYVIRATPDAVWKIGGDTANVADWIPALEKSHQHGDLRYATFADDGGEATERIVHHDDPQRSYTYEYVSGPLPLSFYSSNFTVNPHPEAPKSCGVPISHPPPPRVNPNSQRRSQTSTGPR